MMEMFTLAIDMQKNIIAAHEKSIEASRKALGSASALVKPQEAMRDATKAQMAAWEGWMRLWGWRA
jgi:hypothetical protein